MKCGSARAFYAKYQTIDEAARFWRTASTNATRSGPAFLTVKNWTGTRSRSALMKARLEARTEHGKWDGEWVEHPCPTVNEPHKAMCWLTPDVTLDSDRIADMFFRSGLARFDNMFLKTRLFNTLERPVGTSRQHRLARICPVQPDNPR